jgi:hypothetical protein
MKLMALQRATMVALVSLSLIASGLPISAQARPMMDQPPPHPNNPPNNQNRPPDKDDEKKSAKRVSRDEQVLRQQKRIAHLRFREAYRQRLLKQRAAIMNARYDYYNDPFYYTGPSYRYLRGGQYYTTNEIGIGALKQALNQGYKEGFRAGRADREDRWRYDPRSSFAYQDANYGYDGRRKYGSGGDDNNEWWIAAGVIGAILVIQAIND